VLSFFLAAVVLLIPRKPVRLLSDCMSDQFDYSLHAHAIPSSVTWTCYRKPFAKCPPGRNRYVNILRKTAEAYKDKPYSYLWVQGAVQTDLENNFGVGGFGYPGECRGGQVGDNEMAWEHCGSSERRGDDLSVCRARCVLVWVDCLVV
jgi:hypothetical protein